MRIRENVRNVFWALALVGLLGIGNVEASQPDDLGISVRDKVQDGKERPAILVTPRVAVKKLKVVLTRKSDGKEFVLHAKNLRRGKTKALEFSQPVGGAEYDALFSVTWGKGAPAEFGFTFSALVVGPMKIAVSKRDVDLDAHRLAFTSTRRVQGAEIAVFGDEGREIGRGRAEIGSGAANSSHWIQWKQTPGNVRRLELKVYDESGFWKGLEIRPFFVEPREDQIFFATGSHGVEPSEKGKLNETQEWIQRGVRAARDQAGVSLGMRLYVGGYTDTVGSAESNRVLSEKRARSIASYFRRNGLKIDVFYQGFGEGALALKTEDNVASEKNRRTVYVLSSQAPPKSAVFPRTQWKRLP